MIINLRRSVEAQIAELLPVGRLLSTSQPGWLEPAGPKITVDTFSGKSASSRADVSSGVVQSQYMQIPQESDCAARLTVPDETGEPPQVRLCQTGEGNAGGLSDFSGTRKGKVRLTADFVRQSLTYYPDRGGRNMDSPYE